MWLRWIIDQPRVIFPSPFFSCFTQTEWFRPPHWSGKGKLSMVCETESIPAFVENVCEFIKTTKKKTQMDNYICVFGLLLWFCLYNCLGASWSRTKKRNEGGGVLPFFFLFSFFYFVLSLSLSPSFAQNLDRKLLLRRLSSRVKNQLTLRSHWTNAFISFQFRTTELKQSFDSMETCIVL